MGREGDVGVESRKLGSAVQGEEFQNRAAESVSRQEWVVDGAEHKDTKREGRGCLLREKQRAWHYFLFSNGSNQDQVTFLREMVLCLNLSLNSPKLPAYHGHNFYRGLFVQAAAEQI